MPHDNNNVELKVGDKVMIPCIVKEICPVEDYCNVTVETELGRRPDGNKERISAINTGVLVKQ